MVSLKVGVGVGASKLVWSTWWLRAEENGVGASIQECEEGPGGQKEQCPPYKDGGFSLPHASEGGVPYF